MQPATNQMRRMKQLTHIIKSQQSVWSTLVHIGWCGHAVIVISAFLSFIPIGSGSYPRGLIVALVMAIPMLIYAVSIAAVTGITWSRHSKRERIRLSSVLFLFPFSYGLFALISWSLSPHG